MKNKITKIISIILITLILFIFTGCTYRQNYITKYNDELHAIFGDFTYKYLGKKHDSGVDGLGAHRYKSWEITFTDSYGKEEKIIIKNDKSIDIQIKDIYIKTVEKRIGTEILNEYFNTENTTYTDYVTKEHNFDTLISFEYDTSYNYNEDTSEIINYNNFDLTKYNIYELINDGKVSIEKIIYFPGNDEILSESEIATELIYLTDITKKIDEKIPVIEAIHGVSKERMYSEGQTHVVTEHNQINFK